jgi:type VI secretion system protein ImpL
MFALLRRFLPIILGVLLIALVIWFGGPYVAIGPYIPLESERSRWITIAVVVALFVAWRVAKQLRANRASDQLVAAVVKQAAAEPRPSADVVQLRERFEEAVATLKEKRKSGHSLYELPWYVIIGAPGSGKTTALMNSGLNFPLEQRSGKGALRGVGGTRNCDWWFTDEAVLLDTAGRYTTQDSDASADSSAWSEFLALLRKYRKRRPVNGVILTISAQDLMTQGHSALETHVDAARRRLTELNRELHIQLPVYLFVTKCDLVAGFTEYFEDLPQEGRAQVWGVTFPYEQTLKGETPKAFPAEFDALMTRLNERVFARVEDERDVRHRAKVFGFPQQMASLRDSLTQFVADVFGSTRFDQQILLRGVYFTSGTQEGTPIDRLLGAIGRRFAVAADAVMQPPGRGKAYFIERLLKDVLFAESGLAGVNRRFEFQMAAAQMGAYVAMAVVAVLGVILWSVSYNRNRNYIDDVGEAVAKLQQAPPASTDPSFAAAVPRLQEVEAVVNTANRHRDDIPWSMRWGLYQGNSVGNAAQDAYVRELDNALTPRIEALLRQRLTDHAAEPELLYQYLKAYLMLGDAEHFNRDHIQELISAELTAAYAASPDTAKALTHHFEQLLARDQGLRQVQPDPTRVAQARSSIRQASIPRIIYGIIRLSYADDQRRLRLDEAAGIGSAEVLVRKSGRPLAEPVPALYTKDVFMEVTGKSAGDLVEQFKQDYWVWGDSRPSIAATAELSNQVLDAYETEYIAFWDGILSDFDVSFQSREPTDALAILAGATSPLKNLLNTVTTHTRLVTAAPAAPATPGTIDILKKQVGQIVARGQQALGVSTRVPGQRVTTHFARLHAAVAGEPGASEIDRVLAKLAKLQQELPRGGSQLGGGSAVVGAANPAREELVRSLRQDATALPDAVGGIVESITEKAAGAFRGDVQRELAARYAQDVVMPCRALAANKYPFVKTSATDVRPEDFGELFGFNGVFDRFFKQQLESLVNVVSRPWSWRRDALGASVGASNTVLRQFEVAQRIRDTYFPTNTAMPQVRFTVTPVEMDPTAGRFVLEVDGQRLEHRFGAPRSLTMSWPGEGLGQAVASWEDRAGRPTPLAAPTGPWAWPRLVDMGELVPQNDTRYLLTWRRGNHYATVQIDVASALRNPFGKGGDVQNFSCG